MELVQFISDAIHTHNTSIGDNKALPSVDDFVYGVMSKRFNDIINNVQKQFDYIPTINEAETLLNKLTRKAMEIEKPLRPQLEKLCEAVVCASLGVPQETLLIECQLVDKIEPYNELRVLPEEDEYTYADNVNLTMDDEVLKRRLVNSLVQGAAYWLMYDFIDAEALEDWSEELMPLYDKIIALNDFLIYTKEESISDKNPMLGALVETHLGKGTEKTIITAQGLIYPLLLQETYRGLFELFASHGLPMSSQEANAIIHKADFLMAEAWDIRIGSALWGQFENCTEKRPLANVFPYLFSTLVQLDCDEFNVRMQTILGHTQEGSDFIKEIVRQVVHDEEYQLFKQDIKQFNLDKCVINGEEDNDEVLDENAEHYLNILKHGLFDLDKENIAACKKMYGKYHLDEALCLISDYLEPINDKLRESFNKTGRINFSKLRQANKILKEVQIKEGTDINTMLALNTLFESQKKKINKIVNLIQHNKTLNESVCTRNVYKGKLIKENTLQESSHKVQTIISDKDGNPIKCYHSTQANFDQFDSNKIGSGGAGSYHGFGFNFTTCPNNTYGKNTIEAYLFAKKALWSNKKTININKLIKILVAIDKGEEDSIVCNFTGNNPKIGGIGYYSELSKAAQQMIDYAEGDLDIYADICTAASCGAQKIIDIFHKLGYDSAIETNSDGSIRVVVVFYPEQVHIVSKQINEAVQDFFFNPGQADVNQIMKDYEEALNAWTTFSQEMIAKYNSKLWFLIPRYNPDAPFDAEDLTKKKELGNALSLARERKEKVEQYQERQRQYQEYQKQQEIQNENNKIFDLAIEKFGLTSRLSQAGYILPDGTLLNFGEDGDRGTDHRAIEGVYLENNIDIWSTEYRYNYVVDFLNHGAIRIDANTGLIDMTTEPTNQQYSVLKQLVRGTGGEAYVDFTDDKGNVIHSACYDEAKPQRVVADIMRFYQEGIKPTGDVEESFSMKGLLLKEGNDLLSWFGNSKVVNSDGTPKVMYMGDSEQIETFDRAQSSSSNLYGTGFYFTDSKSHAMQYGNPQPYYLRIIHPLSTNGHEITKRQLLNFLLAVDENEDYGLYNYGYGATPQSVLKSVWGKSDFAMLLDINACCIGDLVEATLLFNNVNGTTFDGFILDTETVVFDNCQIQKADVPINESLTLNEGITDKTYHYCSPNALLGILQNGKIALTLSSNKSDSGQRGRMFYLSTQRSKNINLGYAGNHSRQGEYSVARLTLDGYSLNKDGYVGFPMDYWGGLMGKQSDIGLKSKRLETNYGSIDNIPNFNDEDKQSILKSQGTSSNFEFEDRILSNRPYIPIKYITRIDVYSNKGNGYINQCIKAAENIGIQIYVYDDINSFHKQDNNTINYVDAEDEYQEERPLSKKGIIDTIQDLSVLALYDTFYSCYHYGDFDTNKFTSELNNLLSKFGLEAYVNDVLGYLPDYHNKCSHAPEIAYGFANEGKQGFLRTLSSRHIGDKHTEPILLLAQYVLNLYHVNSFTDIARLLEKKRNDTSKPQHKILESIPCIEIKYDGSSSTILRADDKLFWGENSPFNDSKDYFYQEITRKLDEDDYYEQEGYDEPRTIFHNSKSSESFKKYLQHLMHNDNLSLYDGVVILNKIFHNDSSAMIEMFGWALIPIRINKEQYIELENNIKWSDQESMVNDLFGNQDGYYDYRWPKNESYNPQGNQLNEYLDKDYMKPLYDYLKNGDRYSSEGHYNASERLIIPFFEWSTNLDDNEWRNFKKALNNCSQLQEKIRGVNANDGKHIIRCFSMRGGQLQCVPTREFLKQNARRLFTITYNDPELSQYWDKFYFFINKEEGRQQLKRGQYLDADTVLMNPEIKKPMWLVHFTGNKEDALGIVQNGFKHGLLPNQMSKLGYTNKHIQKTDKQGKYVYAYNAEEITQGFFPADFSIPKDQWRYNNNFDQKVWENAIHYAVMFISSGIEARHDTDNQQQVIFNADMARDFVLLSFIWNKDKPHEWGVQTKDGRYIYKNNSLTNVVKWVMNNFGQYRSKIGW